MTVPLILKYPYDRTGSASTNFVPKERHTLPAGVNRAFAPDYGAFYTAGMVVRDVANGRILTRNVDYRAAHLYADVTMTGNEACAVVVITNSDVSDTVEMDYQVVGGHFASAAKVVQDLVAQLNLDNRTVNWGDIVGKPDEFTAAPHLHALADGYGYEYITVMLEGIRLAILQGDELAHEEIFQYLAKLREELMNEIAARTLKYDQHVNPSVTNPHGTTKGDVELGRVQNYPIASEPQAIGGTDKESYMTPYLTRLLFDNSTAADPVDKISSDRVEVRGAQVQVTIPFVVGRVYLISVLIGGGSGYMYTASIALENNLFKHRSAVGPGINAYAEYDPTIGKLSVYSNTDEVVKIYGVREFGKAKA